VEKLDQAQQDMADFFDKSRARFVTSKDRLAAALTSAATGFQNKIEEVKVQAEAAKNKLEGDINEVLDEVANAAMEEAAKAVAAAVAAEEWTAAQIKILSAKAEQLEEKVQEKALELSATVREQRIKAQQLYDAAKADAKDKLEVLKEKAKDKFEDVQTKVAETVTTVTESASQMFDQAIDKVENGIE